MADIDRTFVALADCTRRRVVDLLRKKPRRAGELADAVGIHGTRDESSAPGAARRRAGIARGTDQAPQGDTT